MTSKQLNPEVSVVVLAYNEASHLDRCLKSLADQVTSIAYEVIVVDDGSEDQTFDVAKKYESETVRIHKLESNMGIGHASNVGFSLCRGRYFVRVDGDDFVSKHFVEVLTVAIREIKSSAVRCDYNLVDEMGNFIETKNSHHDPIACGIIFTRDSVIAAGMYDSLRRVHEDSEFEERYRELFNICRLSIPLYRYRQHANNSSLNRS